MMMCSKQFLHEAYMLGKSIVGTYLLSGQL